MSTQDKTPQGELPDAFTGEVFTAQARNHYERNDGIPFAPPVTMARPSLRQRIENLINRGADPLAHYVGAEGSDMDIPDDAEAPLTASEMNYMDTLAETLAENAPLPDEGLPRPLPSSASPASPQPETPAPPGVSSPPAASKPPPVPSR